jgi:hypothetical protein
VYDVAAGRALLLEDGTRKYVWGAHGLAYAVEGTGSGTPTVYHADGLGSVRALTDAAGAVLHTYETDEFGVPTLTQGASGQPFRFSGEQRDPETGFVYLRAAYTTPPSGGSSSATHSRALWGSRNPSSGLAMSRTTRSVE